MRCANPRTIVCLASVVPVFYVFDKGLFSSSLKIVDIIVELSGSLKFSVSTYGFGHAMNVKPTLS